VYIDIPEIHTFSEEAGDFFEALSKSEEMSYFDCTVIRRFIEFKWPIVNQYTKWKLFMPYLTFMITYMLYMNWIYLERNNPTYLYYNYGCMGLLAICSFYFFVIEFTQLAGEGIKYMYSIWNYLDLIPPMLLMVFLPLAYKGFFDQQTTFTRNVEASL
jgi:hypothetical protein